MSETSPDTSSETSSEKRPERGPEKRPSPEETASVGEAEVQAGPEAGQADLTCDFCGETTPTVRRIALDEGYDRLRTPHAVRYACPACSERKERERRASPGSDPASGG
ncbi:MAG: hypothetical protein ACQGVK_05395 [Myxococcota bacterium]